MDNRTRKPKGKQTSTRNTKSPRGKQGRKDSGTKRVNFDNTRESKFDQDVERMRKASGFTDDRSNDIAWYAKNAELLRSAASLPFSTTVGTKTPYGDATAVPGIMALNWAPVIGGEENAPINQAANQIYSFVVHANSRNYSYNAPDQMALILAGANAFAAIAMGIRAYGTMRLFDQRDMYTPKALVRAMGFNYDDLRNNLAQMWFDLNELIARSKQIWIPNVMPVIERWYWMSSNIYRDGDNVKSQYYLFTPTLLYQLNESSSGGTGLTAREWMSSQSVQHTWADYMQYVNGMINALVNSEDRGIIFGDILKAYGADAIYALNEVSSSYQITPVYDREVLTQIENAMPFGNRPADVTQDQANLTLVQNWSSAALSVFEGNAAYWIPDVQVLNFHTVDTPTPEMIMIATRLKPAGLQFITYSGGEAPSGQLAPITYGTEVVLNINVLANEWAGAIVAHNIFAFNSKVGYNAPILNTEDQALGYMAFDWCPWIYKIQSVALPTQAFTPAIVTAKQAFGDYDNYTYIDTLTLRKMHQTAVYSEFGVPTI